MTDPLGPQGQANPKNATKSPTPSEAEALVERVESLASNMDKHARFDPLAEMQLDCRGTHHGSMRESAILLREAASLIERQAERIFALQDAVNEAEDRANERGNTIASLRTEVERLTIDKKSGWYATVTREHAHQRDVEIPDLLEQNEHLRSRLDLVMRVVEAARMALPLLESLYDNTESLANWTLALGLNAQSLGDVSRLLRSMLDANDAAAPAQTREGA